MKTTDYVNHLETYGIDAARGKEECERVFQTIFYGSEEERFYHEAGEDMGYLEDTGNNDARTEGMSYGMMMCVQMDKKAEFDRIWKWARTYMYLPEGDNAGYFAWSSHTDGSRNSWGAAPDGEEYFAMALIFAGNRWGNGEGIFDYHREAKELLHVMIRKGSGALPGRPMFAPENHLIRFVAELDFTDPSYHLPHFYALYAEYAYKEDREFFRKAEQASREYWKKCCHPVTGLSAEYSYYDGRPYEKDQDKFGRHDWYYSDAYRTIINIALDAEWNGKSDWAVQEAENICSFFTPKLADGSWETVYDIDGKANEGMKVLHPWGLIAANAAAVVLAPEAAKPWVELFLERGLRSGARRYYDNCLYFFVYLLLSGNYRIW